MMRVNNLPPARSQRRDRRCAYPSAGDPCGSRLASGKGPCLGTRVWAPTQRQPRFDPAEHTVPGGCRSSVLPSGTST